MDRHVWGRPLWEVLLLVCDTADRCPRRVARAKDALVLLTQAVPCDPCLCYYAYNVVVWMAEGGATPAARSTFTSWLYDMRAVIDAKVKGSLGCGDEVAGTAAAIIPVSSRYQLFKRAAVGGVTIGSDSIATLLMLMALRVRQVAKKEAAGLATPASPSAFRAAALTGFMAALADLVDGDRPGFAAALRVGLARAMQGHKGEGTWTWKVPFCAAYETSRTLEDGLARRLSMESLVARLAPAQDSLVDWTRAGYLV